MYEITVIGEALVDIVPHHGSTAEIPGGGPANVALGLGRLGVPVEFMTWLGRDERGRCVTQHLEASGVHLTVGSHGAARTSTAEVELDALLFKKIFDDSGAGLIEDARQYAVGKVDDRDGFHALLDALCAL